VVKGEIASPRCPYFLPQIDDFYLKQCILRENPKNNIAGRNTHFTPDLPLETPIEHFHLPTPWKRIVIRVND